MSKGIQKSSFGHLPNGTEIEQYTLTNANGLSCKIITYGGIITEINTPDRHGKFANIVLGYDNLEDYLKCTDYRGAIIGRVANRIAGASFELNGKTYKLAANDGPNHLHGGLRGFDKRVWDAKAWTTPDAVELVLKYTSAENEEGYPGKLETQITYRLTDRDDLGLHYWAKADRDTPVNLTNHTYWNLGNARDILNHDLMIAAENHTPMNSQHIPTGKIEKVAGTPFDFRASMRIGSHINDLPGTPPGYNANYELRKGRKHENAWEYAARAYDPESGRVLDLWTDFPALQFYSGTFLRQPYSGFCLETQGSPDAVHHDNFPSIILPDGSVYLYWANHRFSAD